MIQEADCGVGVEGKVRLCPSHGLTLTWHSDRFQLCVSCEDLSHIQRDVEGRARRWFLFLLCGSIVRIQETKVTGCVCVKVEVKVCDQLTCHPFLYVSCPHAQAKLAHCVLLCLPCTCVFTSGHSRYETSFKFYWGEGNWRPAHGWDKIYTIYIPTFVSSTSRAPHNNWQRCKSVISWVDFAGFLEFHCKLLNVLVLRRHWCLGPNADQMMDVSLLPRWL